MQKINGNTEAPAGTKKPHSNTASTTTQEHYQANVHTFAHVQETSLDRTRKHGDKFWVIRYTETCKNPQLHPNQSPRPQRLLRSQLSLRFFHPHVPHLSHTLNRNRSVPYYHSLPSCRSSIFECHVGECKLVFNNTDLRKEHEKVYHQVCHECRPTQAPIMKKNASMANAPVHESNDTSSVPDI